MILLIDSGNSRVKIGWLDRASGAREPEPLVFEHGQAEAVQDWIKTLPCTPRAAIGANVAGERAASRIQAAVRGAITWIRAQRLAAGVRNGYTTPNQLGADRWMALLGLATHATLTDTPLMLVNVGTATTIDTLSPPDADGVRDFIGGLILPGAQLMHLALQQHTAQLPLAQGQMTAFPCNTDQAIVSGVCAAQAGAVVQQWRRAFAHFGRAPVLYASGGGWNKIAPGVTDAMAQARADLGLAPERLGVLTAPALDGLACLGAQTHGRAEILSS